MNAPSRLAAGLWLVAAGAVAQNLYPNPDFNDVDEIAGWSADPGTVHFLTEDASDCPASGHLSALSEELSPLNFALSARGPCLVFAEAASVEARLLYRGGVASGLTDAGIALRVFSNNACLGTAIDGVAAFFQEVADWTPLAGSFDVPAGGSLGVFAFGAGDAETTVEVDEIRVTRPGYLLVEDHDGGGTCRWSSSVGEGFGGAAGW
jgi:hypothetical protein